jgi:hypothetical protein
VRVAAGALVAPDVGEVAVDLLSNFQTID